VSGPAVLARRPAVSTARMAGYRKLLAFGITAVCATVLQALDKFDPTVATFLGTALLTYVGGNVREHAHRAAQARSGLEEVMAGTSLPPLPTRPLAPRPGVPAPFDEREAGDRTEFDPERPAVDRETLVNLLTDLMADRMAGRPSGRPVGGGR